MSRAPRILLSAGEASGDRLGAGLARALRAARPDVDLVGMGGDEMVEAGVRVVQHASEVAVVGIVEVLAHLPAIRGAMTRLERVLREARPDLVVPVDFPDFNLRLAARAQALGIPVAYYVSPQVWAWRRGRVHRIRRLVRRMLVLFPFEETFYRREGIPVSFVGHPAAESADAADASRDEVLTRAGLDPGRPVVALLPGSRRGEVQRMLPVLLEAAKRLERERPDLQFLVPRATTLPGALIEGLAAGRGPAVLRVHDGDYPAILRASACGAVASGTATLDAALAGLPMVVVYRMFPLTYALGRRLVSVEHVALPNLIAGRRIVPELLQGECSADRIAAELGRLLDGSSRAERMRVELREVRGLLGPPGAFQRAAQAVLGELPGGTPAVS